MQCWGIAVEKFQIKAAKLKEKNGKLVIIDLDITKYPNNNPYQEQLIPMLGEFKKRHKINSKEHVFITFPMQEIFYCQIYIPDVEPKFIGQKVCLQAEDKIPYPIDEVFWDYHVENYKTKNQKAIIFAIRKEILHNFLAELSYANLKVTWTQIPVLAMYNFIKYEHPNLKSGVCDIQFTQKMFMENIFEFSEFVEKLPFCPKKIFPFSHIYTHSKVDLSKIEDSFVVPIGLCIQGLNKAECETRFMPPREWESNITCCPNRNLQRINWALCAMTLLVFSYKNDWLLELSFVVALLVFIVVKNKFRLDAEKEAK